MAVLDRWLHALSGSGLWGAGDYIIGRVGILAILGRWLLCSCGFFTIHACSDEVPTSMI